MIGSSVSARSGRAFAKTPRRAAWVAAAVLILCAPAARAQLFFNFFEPSPQRIERNLDAAGYGLRSPLIRRGDVYIADVVAETGARERLVIDARTARILERFPMRADRSRDRDAEETWDAPARPPQAIAPRPHDDDGSWDDDFARPPRPQDDIARTDPSAKPADPPAIPNVIHGVDGTNGPSIIEVEKPKAKPHKKKPASTASLGKVPTSVPPAAAAVATPPSMTPADTAPPAPNPPLGDSAKPESSPAQAETPKPAMEAKPAAESKPTAAAKPASEAKAVGESKPTAAAKPASEAKAVEDSKPVAAAKPASEAKAVGDSKPAAAAKPASEAKAVGDSKPASEAKPVAEAKPMAEAKPAPDARPEKKSNAVNDVPINPLD
jgi:hypothetical protein